jgi:hypothetical protein
MKSHAGSSMGAALAISARLASAQAAAPLSIDTDGTLLSIFLLSLWWKRFADYGPDNIRTAASAVAWDMLQYYHGNESGNEVGILPGPPPAGDYYWWEAGAMWGTLIDYWFLTGDSTYNNLTIEAMQAQTGNHHDYQPTSVTLSLGNDDQGFWGLSAMLAAENNFPNPPEDRPGWLALAQGVFNTQADPDRHDDTCGGGMRWQIPLTNIGYDYKNSTFTGVSLSGLPLTISRHCKRLLLRSGSPPGSLHRKPVVCRLG